MAEEKKREKFRIAIQEHPEFPVCYDGLFMKSSDLCKIVSDIFREVYSDWEGCVFEFWANRPSISMFFNQRTPVQNSGLIQATSMFEGKSNSGSAVLDAKRRSEERKLNGDRFFLTDEGQEGLERFVLGDHINRKSGKPNWNGLVTMVSPNQNVPMSPYQMMNRVQFTKVSGFDPAKILTEYYGLTTTNGDPVEVAVTITKGMNGMMPGTMQPIGYYLRIDRFYSQALQEKAQADFGYMATDNLGIIR